MDQRSKCLQRGLNKISSQHNSVNIRELMSCSKLPVFPYLKQHACCAVMLDGFIKSYAEVRFKNDRKEFFEICHDMKLSEGDIVAVEGSPGHDIGIITLTGYLAKRQMIQKDIDPEKTEIKKVYRKAKSSDIERWMVSIDSELITLKKTRRVISDLGLDMKLNDVEYQGDGTKAIFYYTAEDRVDFRELIKVLAREFRIRVEMKQIGARQESAKIGGIGPCGRELCCALWIDSFQSVSTQSARTQQISLNPQKLAGQCTKLKCCLNYEYPVYAEALKNFPDSSVMLKTKKGNAVHVKSDIFKNLMWYSYLDDRSCILGLSSETVKQIIAQNKQGMKPENLEDFAKLTEGNIDIENAVDQEDMRKLGLTDDQ
jgi:cell fate regulator YaaT (PSP1 superfamily)